MPRMSSFHESFASIDHIEKQTEYLGNSSEAAWVYTGYIDSFDDSLLLQMPNGSTGTVVSSTQYFLYGKIGASMKTSRDRGVITAFITFSDVQDEIDYEFLGYNLTNPQSNYYAKGILNYTNTRNSSVSDTFNNWHYYEIDWQEDEIQWLIDGDVVRTLKKDDTWNSTTDRYDFPQTPSRVQFSLWPGGSTLNGLGTIEWAGGEINWDSQDIQDFGYYYAYLKNFTVEVYDLPSVVLHLGKGNSSYHAFLFNSTDGDLENVYLTNEKTWLGSGDATGFDPDNEDEDLSETSEIVSLSGSSVTTKTSVVSKSTTRATVNVPGNEQDNTTTGPGNNPAPTSYTGGFVQNSQKTSTSAPSSEKSNSSLSGAYRSRVEGIVTVLLALGAGVIAFGM